MDAIDILENYDRKREMADSKKVFLCLNCKHKANAKEFGTFVECPQCGSERVVQADVWEHYKGGRPSSQTDNRRES